MSALLKMLLAGGRGSKAAGVAFFNQIAYTGNGEAIHPITGVGFKPDKVWIKERTSTSSHKLVDAVRGATLALSSDTTAEEVTEATGLISFDPDGFTLGADTDYNQSGQEYIAWCWNAGGEAVPNLEGSIESTVMANVKGGFSIVKYTGNGIAGATIGHGLETPPQMIVIKSLDTAQNWPIYNATIGKDQLMYLNLTSAASGSSFMPEDPTDSVFSVPAGSFINANGEEYIAYCWHSVAGVSDIGSYIGNGLVDGPIVDCGFPPDYVMIKRATGGTGNWLIFDKRRDPNGELHLYANLSNAEASSTNKIDFTDIGFDIVDIGSDTNINGNTYIYEAFKVSYPGFRAY